jgi:hypothetical protein
MRMRTTGGRGARQHAERLPIDDYEWRNEHEIEPELENLTRPELRKVVSYEERHRARPQLLRTMHARLEAGRGARMKRGDGADGGVATRGTAAHAERGGTRRDSQRAIGGATQAGARRRGAGSVGDEERQGSESITVDRAVIRDWAESRGGRPVVRERASGEAGTPSIVFPGLRGRRSLREIDWDEFYRLMREQDLAFVYQDTQRSGRESRRYRLVPIERRRAR